MGSAYPATAVATANLHRPVALGFIEHGRKISPRLGTVFRILPLRNSKASPLDVKGVKLAVSAADLVAIVREGRERG